MHQLLARLERYDTFPAADALQAALDGLAGVDADDPAAGAARLLWEAFVSSPSGHDAHQALVAWADERLTAWHSLKVNAVEAAWNADRTAQDLKGMQHAVLVSLRQGLHDHPELLADAQLLQALARAKHGFTFTQALRDLRGEGLDLPASDAELKRHCALCANAFKWLLP